MVKRPLHLLLAITFTLLQCAAPLVHAHVNGQLSGLLPPALETQHQPTVQNDCVIEEDESPAITIPHEYQRDEQPVLSHSTPALLFVALPLSHIQPALASPHSVAVAPHYPKSRPQAPPALV